MPSSRSRRRARIAVLALLVPLIIAGCGDDSDSGSGGGSGSGSSSGSGTGSGETLTIGYSAWPGWFPLAVADKAGIFDDVGLDVDLRFFADYVSSLDAMSAGEIDANTQTLNDTMFAVAAGDKQTIVVTNDNSTGNDAIICDKSVSSIEDLKGKTVAAEQGVVDHFLLLQGLESVDLTEDDIDFRGVLTDAAAAGFVDGEFDCVGVFAPFTLTTLERPGSKVLFDSADFPGTISDHIVVTPDLIVDRPDDVQKLVDVWYKTLDYIDKHPDEATKIMAKAADLSVADYESFAEGTTIFPIDEALATFEDSDEPTSLLPTARKINPFLVESGLTKKEAPLDGLLDSSFTEDYAKRNGG